MRPDSRPRSLANSGIGEGATIGGEDNQTIAQADLLVDCGQKSTHTLIHTQEQIFRFLGNLVQSNRPSLPPAERPTAR